jgi:hypothetical protein
MMRSLVLLAIVLFPLAEARAQQDIGARRVVIVSCDGLRPDAITTEDAPVMRQLIATGSYQATCLNEMPPSTLPNHTSMLTGLSVSHHGVLANTELPGRIGETTVFDAARAAGLRVGFFAGKQKLAYLCPEGSAEAWVVDGDLDVLTAAVVAAIENADLRLIFVHFGSTDAAGHNHGWMSDEYMAEVARIDAAIGQIVDAVERAGMAEETVILISADHGGHGHEHWLDIPEDRFIPLILHGAGIAAGRGLCEQTRIMDIAATALYLLGLPTESAADGAPVTEALAESEQSSCSAPQVSFTGLCAPLPLCGTGVSPVLALGLMISPALWWRRRWRLRA